MLMTTTLLTSYIAGIRRKKSLAVLFAILFGAIELCFFYSCLTMFFNGGYVMIILSALLFFVMYVWRRGTAIERSQSVYLPVVSYIDQLRELSSDESYPMTADNLVFLTNDSSPDRLDRDILYSILNKQPKRALAYWFLNVQVTNEPRTLTYAVEDFGTDFIFKVQLRLGFRVNQRVNQYFYQIVSDLIESGQLKPQDHKYSIYREKSRVGDFRFCMIRKVLTPETEISGMDSTVVNAKYAIRHLCGSPIRWYGLESSSVLTEYVPLFTKTKHEHRLTRTEGVGRNATLAVLDAPTDETTGEPGSAPTLGESSVEGVGGKPRRTKEIEEDEADIFTDPSKREDLEREAASYIGGDTATFRPLVIDEDEDESDEVDE
jgi:KUP system potassium uptake protein